MTTFKRGATFSAVFRCTSVQLAGTEVADLTGWTARCTLRTAQDVVIEELAATIIDPVERLVSLVSAGTAGWPKAKALGDVLLIGPGGAPRLPSGTFSFEIGEGPTR